MKRKKVISVVLSAIIILMTVFLIYLYQENKPATNKSEATSTSSIINNILKKGLGTNIDKNFLKWIEQEYSKETIIKLNDFLKENTYQETIWHDITNNSLKVLLDKYNKTYENTTNIKEINTKTNNILLSFIGDVSLADNWYIIPKYNERGKKVYGILSENVVNILTESDISIANNEFTISNRGEKMPGKYYTFKATPSNLSIYEEMGIDLVTLANNHVYDYGEESFLDMLDSLDNYNIPHIGAGKNLEEASKPYYFIANGYKIALVNATRAEKNIMTPGATETTSGVFRCYDPTKLIEIIKETKKRSDFVITLIHWGKEDSSDLEEVQIETSKQYIDAGTDIIIGTHAHTLQGIDFYKNKAIIYNLGDFIFNNETKDTMIFQLKIDNEGNFNYQIIPCQQKEEYTSTLDGIDKNRVLEKIKDLSPNITIDENGIIKEKSQN